MNYLTDLVTKFVISENNEILEKNFEIKTIFENENGKLIIANSSLIKNNYNIRNWNKNRPVCNVRVKEIIEYYKNSNLELVPGIIYTWLNNDIYYIYDGLHRFTALKELEKDFKILLYINFTKNENDIVSDFVNINKSIPIPSVYIENEQLIKKQICQSIADQLCRKYPKFISASRNPHVYNFNRDLLVEYISTFNINFQTKNIDKIVFKILIKLNDHAKTKIKESNIVYPNKCDKYDFYLFYLDKNYIKEQVENSFVELF